jgi:hypothetical protein
VVLQLRSQKKFGREITYRAALLPVVGLCCLRPS